MGCPDADRPERLAGGNFANDSAKPQLRTMMMTVVQYFDGSAMSPVSNTLAGLTVVP
jgi:hypothetical protein